MDAWHGTLIGAITTLVGAVVALWKHANSQRRGHEKTLEALHAKHNLEKDRLHAEHKDDIKELTQAALELGTAVHRARALPPGTSGSSPPSSGETG